jgi:hypothetical protein
MAKKTTGMKKTTGTQKPIIVQAVVPTGFPNFGPPVTLHVGKPRSETVYIAPCDIPDGDIARLAAAARTLPDDELAILLLEKLFREAVLVREEEPAKKCACKGACKKSAGKCAAH